MSDFHVKALELAKAGNWQASHDLVECCSDTFSCLIHGYLHRVEGDEYNARYWYSRAGQVMPANACEEELTRLLAMVISE